MYSSLIGKFRGALVGSYIAELLTFTEKGSPYNISSYQTVYFNLGKLVERHKFDIEDWTGYQQEIWQSLNLAEGLSLNLPITFLPTVLYFHDNRLRMREVLVSAGVSCGLSVLQLESLLATAYMVCEYLQQESCLENFFSRIIDYTDLRTPGTANSALTGLGIGRPSEDVSQVFLTIAKLISDDDNPEEVIGKLKSCDKIIQEAAIALYCFLLTPNNFRLPLLRLQSLDISNTFLGNCSAIVGALAGARNGISSIPSKWLSGKLPAGAFTKQQQLSSRYIYIREAAITTSKIDYSQILELADILMAIWSGRFDLIPYSLKNVQSLSLVTPANSTLFHAND